MPNAETKLGVIRECSCGGHHWRARCREIWHAGFGKRATEKDPTKGHLAGALLHSDRRPLEKDLHSRHLANGLPVYNRGALAGWSRRHTLKPSHQESAE